MRQTSLAADIRSAFQVRRDLLSLAQRARDPGSTPWERDAALREVVFAYRVDRSWSPLLLELLAPAMVLRLPYLFSESPAISDEDVRQRLVVEVLRAATTMPMPRGANFVEYRVLSRAVRCVVRWLEAEDKHLDWTEPFPDDERDDDLDDDLDDDQEEDEL